MAGANPAERPFSHRSVSPAVHTTGPRTLVTAVVAAGCVVTVGLLSPFPTWVAVAAAAVVGLIAPAVVHTHRPPDDDPDP